MRAYPALLLSLCIALGACAGVLAADKAAEKEARNLFRSAFQDGLSDKERVETLESVAKDHADTSWADDALWVLGEMASANARRDLAVRFRRALMDREEPPLLERFTESLPIYADSRIPRVLYLLNLTGNRYIRDGYKAVPFNPLSMLTHDALSLDYEAMDMLELALQECRRSIEAAPKDGLFQKNYKRRAQRLEKKIAEAKKKKDQDAQDKGEAPPDKPPEDKDAPDPEAEDQPAEPKDTEDTAADEEEGE